MTLREQRIFEVLATRHAATARALRAEAAALRDKAAKLDAQAADADAEDEAALQELQSMLEASDVPQPEAAPPLVALEGGLVQ